MRRLQPVPYFYRLFKSGFVVIGIIHQCPRAPPVLCADFLLQAAAMLAVEKDLMEMKVVELKDELAARDQ